MQVGDRATVKNGTCRKVTGEGRKSGETMDAGPLSLAGRVYDI
jgi:hypothetical protein